ncbi:MAG: DMT family transporter [Candidatus Eremiobacteraeota bacterium]|nr:DMT family transporter [Candidatus Eremiobacteraeota bacterium]
MTAVLLGALAATFYGAADFLGGMATRRAAMLAVTAVSQSVGLACLLLVLPFFPGHQSPTAVGLSVLGGVCGGIGIALLYHALSIGRMGVVSPITAVLAAAFPVVVGMVRGDSLRWFQIAGIIIAMLAIGLIAFSREESGEREIATSGVKEAIASGVAIGIFLLLLGASGRGSGLNSLLMARFGSIGFLLLLAAATRTNIVPRNNTLPTAIASGAIDMLANVLFVLAAQTGQLAIAAVITSLYPASTVFLARAFLKERLQASQKAGVVLALLGVALIAA